MFFISVESIVLRNGSIATPAEELDLGKSHTPPNRRPARRPFPASNTRFSELPSHPGGVALPVANGRQRRQSHGT